MNLGRIGCELLISQQNFKIIALSFDVIDVLFNFQFILFNSFIQCVFDLSEEVQWTACVIFELVSRTLDLGLRVADYLIQFLHPLCDNPQNARRLDEEDAVLNLRLRILRGILVYLASNNVFRVGLYLLKVGLIILSWLYIFSLPFLDQNEDLTEQFRHGFLEKVELFVCFIDHIVDDSHYLLRIVSAVLLLQRNHFALTNSTDKVKFGPTFIIN